MNVHCLENVMMLRPTTCQHPKIGVVVRQAALLVCCQMANLTLFKHAHSTHSHKLTEKSVTHVHTSTPFTHIHTTLTIDNLVFTLCCVYNRCSWFVLFVPCTRLKKRGRKLVHGNKIITSLRLRPAACVLLSLS